MNSEPLKQLADELAVELELYRRLSDQILAAETRLTRPEPDWFELRAVGSLLQDIYNGAERILVRVAKTIDRQAPIGPAWHRELLDQMAEPLPNARPAVVQPATVAALEDYRRFRHRARNIYGHELDWSAMRPLVEQAERAVGLFANDVQAYITYLTETASDMDTQ